MGDATMVFLNRKMTEGAMLTAVLRCGHACSEIHMPTPEYQREHGTPK